MDVVSALNQNIVFKSFAFQELQQLAKIGRYETFSAGSAILQEQETSDRLYFILSGIAEVIGTVEEGEKKNTISLAQLSEKNIFGEIAFIDRLPRTASVVAKKISKSCPGPIRRLLI